VLMPMRLPFESNRTPPELPGLMAASVCRHNNGNITQTSGQWQSLRQLNFQSGTTAQVVQSAGAQ
jgi:hypothetical protein